MSLKDAWNRHGARPPLPPGPPYACEGLSEWAGVAFECPPGDPRLSAIHRGEPVDGPPALDNLLGAIRYWEEHPEWMGFLEPDSPIYRDKQLERALYLDRWAAHLPPPTRADGRPARILDLGGGIGRFTTWFLEQGYAVELVDPDLRSLWRAVSHAAGGPGWLDVHWSTGERLPAVAEVDAAVLCEVLCYMEDPAAALRRVAGVLRPGGVLLASVEARWGWAMSADAHPNTIEGLFTGVVHVPGDVWVQTYTADSFGALLAEAGFVVEEVVASHYAFSGPFELASEISELSVEEALALEARLRAHPVAGPLNRAWMAVARLPG